MPLQGPPNSSWGMNSMKVQYPVEIRVKPMKRAVAKGLSSTRKGGERQGRKLGLRRSFDGNFANARLMKSKLQKSRNF